jgi:hypothetical protein
LAQNMKLDCWLNFYYLCSFNYYDALCVCVNVMCLEFVNKFCLIWTVKLGG